MLLKIDLLSPQKNGIIGITNIFKEARQMGIYVNPDNIDFQRAINSQIYVDKSGLIELTNAKHVVSANQWQQICSPPITAVAVILVRCYLS